MFSTKALDKRRSDTYVSVINIAGIRVARTRSSILLVDKNPYLPEDSEYFDDLKVKRSMEAFDYSKVHSRLIAKQKGLCPICDKIIEFEHAIEVDHMIPIAEGGKDTYSNLRLLHKLCHRKIVHGKRKTKV